jgi:hypothetical protein
MNTFRTRATGRRRLIRRGIGVAAVAAAAAAVVPMVASAAPANAATGFTVRISPYNTASLMLDISGASTSAGAPLIDWAYNGGSNQVFTFEPSGSYYQIVNQNSGLCLYADGIAGDVIYQEPCNGSAPEQWATGLTSGSIYAYTIQNPVSGLYMDVNGDSPWEGTQIIQWSWNGGSNQYFSASAA